MNTVLVMSLLTAMTFTLVYTLRYLMNGEYSKAATVLATWLGAFFVVFAFSRSQLGTFSIKDLVGIDLTLADANGWTLLIFSYAVGAAAVGFNEVKAAIDNTDTARKGPLFPSKPPEG